MRLSAKLRPLLTAMHPIAAIRRDIGFVAEIDSMTVHSVPKLKCCPFEIRRSLGRVAHCDTALPASLANELWQNPAELVGLGEQLRANGARQTVRIAWEGRPFVLKHYVEPTRRHALKQLVEPARAWSTWLFSHRLADAGILTPRPVACVENRWGVLRRDSFLLYPYVEGRTLRSLIADQATDVVAQSHLWGQLEAVWKKLVELRVGLSDTNLGNFILDPSGELWLIDLDKSRFHRSTRSAEAAQCRARAQLIRSAKKCGVAPFLLAGQAA